jgi:hypothetical protein
MRLKSVSVVAVVLAVALVALAAGCGGGSKKSSSASTQAAATTTEAMTTEATTTEAMTTEATTTEKSSVPTFASAKNCKDLAALGAKLSQAIASSSAGGGGASLDDTAKAFQALANAAPSEIRGDFQTFAAAFTTYIGALEKSGYKPGSTKAPSPAQIAALTEAAKALDAPKLRTAEQHLTAWAQQNCKGVVPSTTGP